MRYLSIPITDIKYEAGGLVTTDDDSKIPTVFSVLLSNLATGVIIYRNTVVPFSPI